MRTMPVRLLLPVLLFAGILKGSEQTPPAAGSGAPSPTAAQAAPGTPTAQPQPVPPGAPGVPAAAPAGATAPAPAAEAEPPVSPDDVYIEGRIKPVPGDKTEPAQVILIASTLDERDNEVRIPYRVVPDAIGQRLAVRMLHNVVEVRCILQNRGSEDKPEFWITVKSFVLIPESGH